MSASGAGLASGSSRFFLVVVWLRLQVVRPMSSHLSKGTHMTKQIEIINIKELSDLMKCSVSNIYFQLAERRKGRGDFPQPLHGYRKRCLWLRSEVENFIERRNAQANPSPQSVPKRKQSDATAATLAQFGLSVQ
jgi:predicted DNA-binding transcriptional regulator AlpA